MDGTCRTCTKKKEYVRNVEKLKEKYHLRDLDADGDDII
jgi:hypothetical protein